MKPFEEVVVEILWRFSVLVLSNVANDTFAEVEPASKCVVVFVVNVIAEVVRNEEKSVSSCIVFARVVSYQPPSRGVEGEVAEELVECGRVVARVQHVGLDQRVIDVIFGGEKVADGLSPIVAVDGQLDPALAFLTVHNDENCSTKETARVFWANVHSPFVLVLLGQLSKLDKDFPAVLPGDDLLGIIFRSNVNGDADVGVGLCSVVHVEPVLLLRLLLLRPIDSARVTIHHIPETSLCRRGGAPQR